MGARAENNGKCRVEIITGKGRLNEELPKSVIARLWNGLVRKSLTLQIGGRTVKAIELYVDAKDLVDALKEE